MEDKPFQHFKSFQKEKLNEQKPNQQSKDRRVKFRTKKVGFEKDDTRWIISITAWSFFLSVVLSFVSNEILQNNRYLIGAFFIVLAIIIIGIVFDIIGIAVASADEAPFHAMASRKVHGAKRSIYLIRNANKVSSFCNDVIGDICGILSGAASISIVGLVAGRGGELYQRIAGLGLSGLIAALTIGGKALGKTVAINKSNYIVFNVSVIISFFLERLHIREYGRKPRKRTKKAGKNIV